MGPVVNLGMGGLFSKRKASLVVVGLDNSGKTTIIRSLQGDDVDDVTPTVGYSTQAVTASKVKYFVIDAADDVRLVIVKDELDTMLAHPDLAGRPDVPVLFFANKMDLDDRMDVAEISEELQLASALADRPWTIRESIAISGVGLDEGMAWLSKQLPPKK